MTDLRVCEFRATTAVFMYVCNVATRCVTAPDESKQRQTVTSLLRKPVVLDNALRCNFRSLVPVD